MIKNYSIICFYFSLCVLLSDDLISGEGLTLSSEKTHYNDLNNFESSPYLELPINPEKYKLPTL